MTDERDFVATVIVLREIQKGGPFLFDPSIEQGRIRINGEGRLLFRDERELELLLSLIKTVAP